jgi:hypothetical protein
MTAAEYQNMLKGKGSSRVRSPSKKPEKKAQSGQEQMDLSEPDECKVLDCVTINSKAQYAEYNQADGYIRVDFEGQEYYVTASKKKPKKAR